MRESMLLAAVQNREDQGKVVDLRDAKITLVQSDLNELIEQLTSSTAGDENSEEMIEGIAEGMKEALEEFFRDNSHTVFSPITDVLDSSQDVMEEISEHTKEGSKLADLRHKAFQKILQFKFLLLFGAVMSVVHGIEKMEIWFNKVVDAIRNKVDEVRDKNPLNTPNVRAAEDVVALEHRLSELNRDPEANADEIKRVEGDLVHARENLSNTVADSDTFNFSDRTPTSSLERQMEGWQRQIDVAESMGNPANPMYVGQVEGLSQEIERRKNDPNWVEPTPEGVKERTLDFFRRGADFMSPRRDPVEVDQDTHGAIPLGEEPSRGVFGRMMDRIIAPAGASFIDTADMPATFGEDVVRLDPIIVTPSSVEGSRHQIPLSPNTARLMEKMENNSGNGGSGVRLNSAPPVITMPTTVQNTVNNRTYQGRPSVHNNDSVVFRDDQSVFNWNR